jgi:hypothetical protein
MEHYIFKLEQTIALTVSTNYTSLIILTDWQIEHRICQLIKLTIT